MSTTKKSGVTWRGVLLVTPSYAPQSDAGLERGGQGRVVGIEKNKTSDVAWFELDLPGSAGLLLNLLRRSVHVKWPFAEFAHSGLVKCFWH